MAVYVYILIMLRGDGRTPIRAERRSNDLTSLMLTGGIGTCVRTERRSNDLTSLMLTGGIGTSVRAERRSNDLTHSWHWNLHQSREKVK